METFMNNKKSIRVFLLLSVFVFCSHTQAADVLTLSPKGEQLSQISTALNDELEGELDFERLEVDKKTSVEMLANAVESAKPKVVLLIGNASVNLYSKYQKLNKDKEFPAAIALAALFLDKFLPDIENAVGIRYEIPLVTSAINVRSLLKKDVKRIGVLHRELMSDFISINSKLAAAEGIELVPLKLSNKESNWGSSIKNNLKTALKEDIDALWVINDNVLLNGSTLAKSWLPVLKQSKLPVIVGVESLLNSKLQFGTFAVVPDHYGLGEQAASLLIDIMDNDWAIEDSDLEQPLSVRKIVNASLLDKKKIDYKKDGLVFFDEVMK